MSIKDYRKDRADEVNHYRVRNFMNQRTSEVLQSGWSRNGGCGYAEKNVIEVLQCLIG